MPKKKEDTSHIRINPTRGIGPTPCEIMCVSDYPGRHENYKGIPLQGKTGDEVKRYLDGDTLPHFDDVFIVNLIRSWNPSNEYSLADVERDEHLLLEDLDDVQPSIIVTLGRWSTRWFLGDVNMDEVQGIPWLFPERSTDSVFQLEGANGAVHWWTTGRASGQLPADHGDAPSRPVIFPIYNPAAGFRSPEVQAYVQHGFRELGHFIAGKVEPRELFKDPFPNPHYKQVPNDKAWIRAALLGVREIFIDSEGHPDDVWSLQFSVNNGEAYLIRIDQTEALIAFFEWMLTTKPLVTYHGSLHDFTIMRVIMTMLGIDIERLYDVPFDDTQIMSYLLQLEPIGLKPNCVRHCNMPMQDYDEVLGDAQVVLAQDYLLKVYDHEQREYKRRQKEAFEEINRTPLLDKEGKPKRDKGGMVRYRRTRVLPKLPMSELHKAAKRVLNSSRPFELWEDQREDIKVAAYNLEV